MSADGGEDRIAAALAEQSASHARLAETVAALKDRAAPRAVATRTIAGLRARAAEGAARGARLAADRPVAVVGIVVAVGASLAVIRRLRGGRAETED